MIRVRNLFLTELGLTIQVDNVEKTTGILEEKGATCFVDDYGAVCILDGAFIRVERCGERSRIAARASMPAPMTPTMILVPLPETNVTVRSQGETHADSVQVQ